LKTSFRNLHIPEHCGRYKGVIRYRLGLIVPTPERDTGYVKAENLG
jgi:aspartyl/asparaginyl beta-hydroxylase (cupin superfamily)